MGARNEMNQPELNNYEQDVTCRHPALRFFNY